jgi:DNA-binding MarR family transcriptional regulator
MSPTATYLQFLTDSEQIRNVGLNPTEERLLYLLAAKWYGGSFLTVMQARGLDIGTSATTVYRHLNSLRSKEFIVESFKPGNKRTRYVQPSPKAMALFEKLGIAMRKGPADLGGAAAPPRQRGESARTESMVD